MTSKKVKTAHSPLFFCEIVEDVARLMYQGGRHRDYSSRGRGARKIEGL